MPEQPTVIRVDGVYKNFKLPHLRNDTLKSYFTSIFNTPEKHRSVEIQHALNDISFEIKKGEFFGIVGRNGSGKSTLLKMLAGIYQPTKGSIHVIGKLVPFIELGVGFNPELTGRENVYLNGSLLNFSKTEIEAMYDDIVEFAELKKFMDQKLKNYSSGMQVRLAFSMAIRAEADILLVDEVLAVGDADFQRKCFEYFRTLKKNKKTVVFVSHDMSAVREYCDRAILIEKSNLIMAGSSSKVATEYTKMFTPSTNLQVGKKNSKRWGDHAIVQKKVTVNPEVSNSETKEIEIEVSFEVKQAVVDPVFGILIKNSAGAHILGNNSKIKHLKSGKFEPGQTAIISWKVPNIFNDGQYLIDVAINHSDCITQYDWWEDAAKFIIYKEEKTPYSINPSISVKLERD